MGLAWITKKVKSVLIFCSDHDLDFLPPEMLALVIHIFQTLLKKCCVSA